MFGIKSKVAIAILTPHFSNFKRITRTTDTPELISTIAHKIIPMMILNKLIFPLLNLNYLLNLLFDSTLIIFGFVALLISTLMMLITLSLKEVFYLFIPVSC